MGRHKNLSNWADEVQIGEIYEEIDEKEGEDNLIDEAYEALNRFCQKEQKRSKNPKRRRHCWQ